MQTFTQELQFIAAKSYREVTLPVFRERAPKLALEALNKLKEEARHKAISGVDTDIDIGWAADDHLEVLFELVREHVPVDVEVSLNADNSRIILRPGVYGKGSMGLKEYDFPCWGRHGVGVRHNLSYLKNKKKQRDETSMFEMILRMFGCLEGDIERKPGDFSLPFAVEILDRVLTWAMEDVSTAGGLSHEDYKKLFARMAIGAGNISQMKSVEDAYVGLFYPK